ncbi:unnamed protein product, partial [Oppiella nova]
GAFTEGPFRPAVTRTIDDYCKHEGFIPGPDPTSYYKCEYVPDQCWNKHLEHCPDGGTWDEVTRQCKAKPTLPPTPTTPPPTPTTQSPTTQTAGHTTSSIDYWCSKDGYMPHPSDPHEYFQCEWIPGKGWYLHLQHCPGVTKWVQVDKKCDGV